MLCFVSHSFAYLARMKLIQRWGLMRNRRFGGNVDPERTALLAVFHDAEEVITGDLPTPITYVDPQVAEAIDGLAAVAKDRLLRMVPDDLRGDDEALFFAAWEDDDAWACVKAAGKICAYLKCVEEHKAGNAEFGRTEETIRAELDAHPDRGCVRSWTPSARASA